MKRLALLLVALASPACVQSPPPASLAWTWGIEADEHAAGVSARVNHVPTTRRRPAGLAPHRLVERARALVHEAVSLPHGLAREQARRATHYSPNR